MWNLRIETQDGWLVDWVRNSTLKGNGNRHLKKVGTKFTIVTIKRDNEGTARWWEDDCELEVKAESLISCRLHVGPRREEKREKTKPNPHNCTTEVSHEIKHLYSKGCEAVKNAWCGMENQPWAQHGKRDVREKQDKKSNERPNRWSEFEWRGSELKFGERKGLFRGDRKEGYYRNTKKIYDWSNLIQRFAQYQRWGMWRGHRSLDWCWR